MPANKRIKKTTIELPEDQYFFLKEKALELDDRDAPKKKYKYDPHLDPQLQWAGKAEHTSFEVPTVSLHVHERIDSHTIINTVKKKNGKEVQLSLFSSPEENPPLREAGVSWRRI